MLSWALGTITKKIIGGEQTNQNSQNSQTASQTQAPTSNQPSIASPQPKAGSTVNPSKPSNRNQKENGWEDDFDIEEDLNDREKLSASNNNKEPKNIFGSPKPVAASPLPSRSSATTSASPQLTAKSVKQPDRPEQNGNGWETDNWNDDDEEGWDFKVDEFKPTMKEEKQKSAKKD